MTGVAAEVVALGLLALALAVAVVRPRGWSEAVGAVPAAALVVILGIVPGSAAITRLREIGPTVGFLAAILVFGRLCARAGIFDHLGGLAASASAGRSRRLLVLVVVLAAGVTAVLTLDATVVLLTPVVLATVGRLGVGARPHLYACTRIANSGSLLLPVSNLTNLLAFTAADLSFARFTALMALPWVVACALEYTALRLWFRADLPPGPAAGADPIRSARPAPRYALTVLAGTVALVVLSSSLHVAPAWAATAGSLALLADARVRRSLRPGELIRSASPGFCAFVLALAVVVEAVTRAGLRTALGHLLPTGTGLLALLALAALAAALANLVNNLPATLALVPLVATSPAAVLAVLLGVNIGPNATYSGSLATLLWRRMLPVGDRPDARQFHAFGLATVPVILAAATVALWAGVRVLGAR